MPQLELFPPVCLEQTPRGVWLIQLNRRATSVVVEEAKPDLRLGSAGGAPGLVRESVVEHK